MSAGIYHWSIEKGTDGSWGVALTQVGSSSALDITGWTIALRVYDRQGGTLLWTRDNSSGTSGISIVSGAGGTLSVYWTAAESTALTWIRGWYCLEVSTDAATPVVTRHLAGDVRVVP